MTTENMMGMKIEEFIAARLDKEEGNALDAQKGPWLGSGDNEYFAEGVVYGQRSVSDGQSSGPAGFVEVCAVDRAPLGWRAANMFHIVGQDPAATLARVEALRKTVDVLTSAVSLNPEHDLARLTGAMALRHVAAIWRSHPDYREEWAPS